MRRSFPFHSLPVLSYCHLRAACRELLLLLHVPAARSELLLLRHVLTPCLLLRPFVMSFLNCCCAVRAEPKSLLLFLASCFLLTDCCFNAVLISVVGQIPKQMLCKLPEQMRLLLKADLNLASSTALVAANTST